MGVDANGTVSIVGAARNIIAVTAGNVVGGTLLVAGAARRR
jgi:formate transporter